MKFEVSKSLEGFAMSFSLKTPFFGIFLKNCLVEVNNPFFAATIQYGFGC